MCRIKAEFITLQAHLRNLEEALVDEIKGQFIARLCLTRKYVSIRFVICVKTFSVNWKQCVLLSHPF